MCVADSANTAEVASFEDIQKQFKSRIADAQDAREKIIGVEEAVAVVEQTLTRNAEKERQRVCEIFREV